MQDHALLQFLIFKKQSVSILICVLKTFLRRKEHDSVAFPRQIAMYLSRELTDFSLPKIGSEFGGRDHSTVIHAHEKISTMLKDDQALQQDVQDIKNSLGRG